MAIPPSPAIAHVTTCRDDGAAGLARAQTMGGQQMIETPAAKRIGDAVRQLLAESSMSKARFAQQAEMSREQLTRIIQGEVSSPRDDTLRKIARAAGRDSEALVAIRDGHGRLAQLDGNSDDDVADLRPRLDHLEQRVDEIAEMLRAFMQPPGDGQGPGAP